VFALGAAAFVAFVPQHVAMMAGAQNDSLAELLLALIVYQISNYKIQVSNCRWVAVGVLLGLGLVTKATVYIAVPLVAIAIWLTYRAQPSPHDWKRLIKNGTLVFVPALVIALPLWIRNIVVYGWPDFFASIRHDAVVLGQPTPAEWIARYGLAEYLHQFVVTTFQSFWGQFGWMGVPMNGKYYAALAVFSLVAFIGLCPSLKAQISNIKRRSRGSDLRFDIWILIFWFLLALLAYVGYNLKYVQFQGRYLFSALIPIGLAFTVGWRQWTLLLPRAWQGWVLTGLYVGLAVLDVVALFRMIVPTLAP
jgi:hypothetical protein